MSLFTRNYSNPLYNTWRDMRRRCYNPDRPDYKYYGAKGVTVCEEWNRSFFAFATDMAASWFPGASIERKDNTKGYYKENCCWATIQEQQLNRSHVKGHWRRKDEVFALLAQGLSRKEICIQLQMSYTAVGRIIRGEAPCG